MNEKEDLTPKTRREILMCQEAAERGANAACQHLGVDTFRRPSWPGTWSIAKKLYPLKKTMMREVVANGLRYRLNDGKLEYYSVSEGWKASFRLNARAFLPISDLYTNPTVEVDDD